MMSKLTPEERQIVQIQEFLLGKLNEDVENKIKQRIREDKAFAKEVEKYRFLFNGLHSRKAMELRQKMDLWEDNKPNKIERLRPLPWMYPTAAVILLLITFGFLYQIIFPPEISPQQLYTEAFIDFEPDLILRGNETLASSEEEKYLQEALELYQSRKYKEAIPLFTLWLNQEGNPGSQSIGNARICLGVALMNDNKVEAALNVFSNIPKNSAYYQHALWYQGLANLNQGKTEQAKSFFQQLKLDPFYGNRAQDLLKGIE